MSILVEPQSQQVQYNAPQQANSASKAATPWGAIAGFASDIVTNIANGSAAKKQRNFITQQNNLDYARQKQFQAETERYNSTQNQVSQMKQAGLNPALSTMQSNVSTPSSSQAPASSLPQYSNNAAAHIANAQALQLQKAQIENLGSQSANLDENTRSQDIDNLTRYTRNTNELLKQLKELDYLQSQIDLNDTQRKQIEDTKQSILDNYSASVRKMNAESDYISGAQTNKTLQDVKTGKAQEHNLNVNSNYTSGALTENTLADTGLKNAQRNFTQMQRENLAKDFDIDMQAINRVSDLLREHGFSEDNLPFVLSFLKNAAHQAGSSLVDTPVKTMFSWLDAGNILPYLAKMSGIEVERENNIRTNEQSDKNNERFNNTWRETAPTPKNETAPTPKNNSSNRTSPAPSVDNKLEQTANDNYKKLDSEHKRAVNEWIASHPDASRERIWTQINIIFNNQLHGK